MDASRAEGCSSSLAPQLAYDIFVSFRGTDTRNKFTSLLFAALEDNGFRTFRDDKELKKGEFISDGLLKAIEGSRISLIVFSKDYAGSRWCLDELVKIMDCKETLKQIVVPIFYDVVPSDVRKQTGVLHDVFAEHEKHFTEGSDRKVKKWRKALTEAANLSGWNLLNEVNGDEAELMKMIIKYVREKVNPTHPNVPDRLVGLDHCVAKLNMLLNMKFNCLGIVAIGGIGKTTIAKRLYNLNKHKFERRSFLANVRDTSWQPNGLVELQKKLLLAILKRPHEVSNCHEGIELIKKTAFGRKKVLLVLDDVDNVQQLKALAIDQDSFAPGSKIIITTKDKFLLKILELDANEIYGPKKLDEDKSLELFSWHAFNEDHPPEDHLDLSRQIGHYAGGLPLALEVLGSYFRGETIPQWESAIAKLRKIPDDDVQGKLNIMGREMVRQESLEDPGKRSRLWYPDDVLEVLRDGTGTEATKGLILNATDVQVNAKPFEKMDKLWCREHVLEVRRDGMGTEVVEGRLLNFNDPKEVPFKKKQKTVQKNDPKDVQVNAKAFEKMNNLLLLCLWLLHLWLIHLTYVHLTAGYEHISKRLLWLSWKGFPWDCILWNFSMEKLVALDLRYSSLKKIWNRNMILDQLKFLYLNKLLALDMKNCTKLRKLPSGVWMLKSLICLDLSGCSKLGCLFFLSWTLPPKGVLIFPSGIEQAFDATSNRAHLVKADESGPTASNSKKGSTREALNRDCLTNALSLEDLRQHFGARHKDAAKGLCDSLAWKSFEVLDSLPLEEQSNSIRRLAQRRTLTHKHCVRLKRSQDLPRSMQRGCSGGLAAQSDIGLPNGGHILSLSKKKIVRKTLKRECRTMSVLSLEDHQQHVGRREDAVKFLGRKRICRQLAIHRKSTAKRICRQLGTRRWSFKQYSAISLPDGGHILDLSKKKIVKTLKRKCRMTSVLSLDYHQHVDSRWEDAVISLGAKRIRRQLAIHRVSITKRIRRQHGLHRWPFQQIWATMKEYSLGDERPLVSRLQCIHISWLGRFSPQPSALTGGGEIVGPIALSSSEFAATNNNAQRVGQDKSGSTASDSENKRTREQEDREDIYTSITLDDLRQHYGRKRKDAAESLGVSESTLKRTCRQYGIKRWPNIIRKKAGRPPDQYGGKNPSPTWKRLSTNGQTEMENQMVGHLEEMNELFLDFVEGPNEGGVSSELAFQLKNQWTVSTSYPNSNGPEVPHPHIASTQIVGENMGSLGDRKNSFCSLEEHLLQGQISGSMWTVPPCSDPASSQHIPTISPTMGSSEDRINSLACLQDILLEEDVSGSISWTIPSCSEPAPGQLMPSVPQTTGSSDDLRNLLPSVEESFLVGHVSGFINPIVPSCSYPAPSQPMSTVPHTTGSSDDLRFLLDSVEEPFRAGHVSESINLTVPSCSDPTPSQSVPTILTERPDTRSVNLKATYVDTIIKFQFHHASGINELKEEVSKILKCELGSFDIEYEDEDGDWILMARDENVREYLQLVTKLGKQVTILKVRDKVPKPRIFVIDSDVINSDH